jgi:hypothetical protein
MYATIEFFRVIAVFRNLSHYHLAAGANLQNGPVHLISSSYHPCSSLDMNIIDPCTIVVSTAMYSEVTHRHHIDT